MPFSTRSAVSASRSGVASISSVSPVDRPILLADGERGRKSATAAAMTRTSKRGPSGGVRARRAACISAAVSARATWAPAGGSTETLPRIRVTAAPRSRASSAMAMPHLARRAIADEADGVDRLGRAAGGDDDVETRQVVRAAGAGAGRGRGRGGSCLPRAAAGRGVWDPVARLRGALTASTVASTMRSRAREPALADHARSERARLRLDDAIAELPQPGHVGLGGRVGVHAAVHGRGDDHRHGGGQAGGRDRCRRPGRGPWPPSQWAVAGATTIASTSWAAAMWPIRPSPWSDSTSESTGWRLSVSSVSVPMNSTAELVIRTRTSAPSS